MDPEAAQILDRIRRAETRVAKDLIKNRNFYPRAVRTAERELVGYERDLIAEPLTEAEGRMLLASSLASASDSVLHLLYQGRNGLSIRRMCALIHIVESTGRHEFARESDIHTAIREGRWPQAAMLLTAYMVRRGMAVENATALAEQIRYHDAGQAHDEAEGTEG